MRVKAMDKDITTREIFACKGDFIETNCIKSPHLIMCLKLHDEYLQNKKINTYVEISLLAGENFGV